VKDLTKRIPTRNHARELVFNGRSAFNVEQTGQDLYKVDAWEYRLREVRWLGRTGWSRASVCVHCGNHGYSAYICVRDGVYCQGCEFTVNYISQLIFLFWQSLSQHGYIHAQHSLFRQGDRY
jgi:hypothetical protein